MDTLPKVTDDAIETGKYSAAGSALGYLVTVEAMIDIALEEGFDTFFVQDLMAAQDETQLLQLMAHPRTAIGFSDSGAHVSQIFDSFIFTHLLAYWVRERQALSLESAVQIMTSQPANMWRLHERGRLQPGYAADIVVFDPDTVAPLMPRAVNDLPGSGTRIEQRATGFAATIVNGEVLIRDAVPSERRPGRLLRSRHPDAPQARRG